MKKPPKTKQKVLVAMSGGVDSSVAAALLLKQGYEVAGGFIKNWSETKDPATGSCAWRSERRDALRVAAQLGIPLYTFDFEKHYRKLIVDELYRGYAKGETPNPDVLCNEYIKFGLFWDQAKKLGFNYMATGHYAIISRKSKIKSQKSSDRTSARPSELAERSGDSGLRTALFRGMDKDKDQSYFLYRISPESLMHSLMPIGGYKKTEIRKLAKQFKLKVAEKPDSQGICFIGKIDFGKFLSKKIKSKPGPIITAGGKQIGEHLGLHNYTIGQRQKIAVADKHPWYVVEKDAKNNTLIVTDNQNDKCLLAKELVLDDLHWLSGKRPKNQSIVLLQVRYHQQPHPGMLKINGKQVKIVLKKPVNAAAIGQSAVIYKSNECLGGGVIRQIKRMC